MAGHHCCLQEVPYRRRLERSRDTPHEFVNHCKGEITNKNVHSGNPIGAKWSVMKMWIRKLKGGKLLTHNNRSEWMKSLHSFHDRET